MSEKRFIVENERTVYDNLFHRGYVCSWKIDAQELVGLLNEQQAIIRRLQDLCGESDSENAKLRIENKELQEELKLLKPVNIEQYEQIVQLQEENEQLKSLVNACEYGQKSLMEEMKHNDEALDKIWEIMKELYGVIDDE